MGLGGHAGQPLRHPAVQARRVRHVPGVDEHRRADVRAVLEEHHHARGVQVLVADVVADLDAHMAGRQTPVEFAAGRLRVLERHLGERQQPAGRRRADVQGQVVEDAGDLQRLRAGAAVGEEDRGGGDHLDVDPVGRHVRQPHLGVPAVGADPAELLRAHHDHGVPLALDAQRGPVRAARLRAEIGPAARHVVGVDVDDAHRVSPCPGGTSRTPGRCAWTRSRRTG